MWVDIYLRMGEWMWRCDAYYDHERQHGEKIERVLMDISREQIAKVLDSCVRGFAKLKKFQKSKYKLG